MSTFSTSSRQKRLKTLSFLHFWLRNVLRATTACTFSALFRHLNLQKWSENGVFCTFWLGNVLRATTACTFSTSGLPKVVRSWGVLYILTWKCASRHNGVHFFDISTSKSGPIMVCFAHFDLEMCFAPQRRALFRHRNFEKCSEREVFLPFSLANVLRPTTACNFSSLIWPAGSAPAALASLLFDPGATNHWKNTVFRDFPTFSRICIFFLLIFSLLPLLTSAFQLSILSEVSLLNFLRPFTSYLHTRTISIQFIYHVYAIYIPFTYRLYTIYIPFTYHLPPFAHRLHTINIPFKYNSITSIYTPFIYHLHTCYLHRFGGFLKWGGTPNHPSH